MSCPCETTRSTRDWIDPARFPEEGRVVDPAVGVGKYIPGPAWLIVPDDEGGQHRAPLEIEAPDPAGPGVTEFAQGVTRFSEAAPEGRLTEVEHPIAGVAVPGAGFFRRPRRRCDEDIERRPRKRSLPLSSLGRPRRERCHAGHL